MTLRLDTITNVVLITTALIVMGLSVARYARDRSYAPLRSGAGYQAGDTIGPIAALEFGRQERTLLLVLQSTCQFCTESMPFYRGLVDAVRDGGINLQVVAASFETTDITSRYLVANSLTVDHVMQIQPGTLRVYGTPTILLVDRGGTVQFEKRGRLPPNEEQWVRQALLQKSRVVLNVYPRTGKGSYAN